MILRAIANLSLFYAKLGAGAASLHGSYEAEAPSSMKNK